MKEKLIDICNPKQWKTLSTSELLEDGYSVYGANGIIGYYNEYNHEKETVMVTCRGATCGTVNISKPFSYINGNAMCMDDVREDIDTKYLYYALKHYDFRDVISGSAQPQITRQGLNLVHIEVVEKEKQLEIVKVLSDVEEIINKKTLQLAEYDQLIKSRFVEMFGNIQANSKNYELAKLRDISSMTTGGTPSRTRPDYFNGDIPWITTVSLGKVEIDELDAVEFITEEAIKNSSTKIIPAGSLLFGTRVGVGKISLNKIQMCTNQDIVAITNISEDYDLIFLKSVIDSYSDYFNQQKRGATIQGIKVETLKDINIPKVGTMMQKEYGRFVQQVDKLKFEVQKSLDETKILFDSLMQKYFG